jgi:hypothetical protein
LVCPAFLPHSQDAALSECGKTACQIEFIALSMKMTDHNILGEIFHEFISWLILSVGGGNALHTVLNLVAGCHHGICKSQPQMYPAIFSSTKLKRPKLYPRFQN